MGTQIASTPPAVGGFLPISPRASAPAPLALRKQERVEIRLTIAQATLCYVKLHRILNRPARKTPTKYRPNVAISDPLYILDVLDKRLLELPGTTPIFEPKPGGIKFQRHDFTLKVRKNEAAYLLKIVKNDKLSRWRRAARRRARLSSLEVLEIAEEEGGRASFFGPVHPENPHAGVPQAVVRKALGELPKRLRMSAEDVAALLGALSEAGGNVALAARRLGQPQRKTARQIARIKKHLRRRGLAA